MSQLQRFNKNNKHSAIILMFILVVTLALSGCTRRKVSSSDLDGDSTQQQADTATVADSPVPSDVGTEVGSEAPPSLEPPPVEGAPQMNVATEAPATPAVDSAAPTPAPAESTSVAGTGELATYSVQKGDTLMKIAFNIYGDIDRWKDIYQMNKDSLNGFGKLKVGTMLKYDKPASTPAITQNGDPYLIKTGDTLGKIADDVYGQAKKWRKLYENNRQLIKDPNRIFAGFYIYYQITEEERHAADARRAQKSQNANAAPVSGNRMPASMGTPSANPAMPSQGQ